MWSIVRIFAKLSSWLRNKKATESSDSMEVVSSSNISQSSQNQRKGLALLVGVNKYITLPGSDLQGCVNDVESMRSLLIDVYHYDPDDVRVLVDERATKQAILERLEWLMRSAIPGDHLVFHFSGHGSRIRDRDGDELDDHLDELICPTDMDWDDPLTDDILAVMFKKIPKGVDLTFLCDACHSGSMSREIVKTASRYVAPPFDVASRSLGKALPVRRIGLKNGITYRGAENVHVVDQNHILMSGCRDDQTSADAFIDSKFQGAFTSSFDKVARSNPNGDWFETHRKVLKLISECYTQVPQLTGSISMLQDKIFGGVK